MTRRRIQRSKQARTKVQAELIELSPHVYEFVPAWKVKRDRKSR